MQYVWQETIKPGRDLKDFVVDWSEALATSEIIVDSVWYLPTVVEQDKSELVDSVKTSVWVTASAVGSHVLTNVVTTDAGRVFSVECVLRAI